MEYKYCSNDYFEDFACGRVIYNKAGMSNFPVRLSQEIFGRCLSYLENKKGICIYDPCCGCGYMLTVLGFLNMDSINKIIGSGIDGEAVGLARQNLSLLTEEELKNRTEQLEDLYGQFHKASQYDSRFHRGGRSCR